MRDRFIATEYGYDEAGNLVETKDPNGNYVWTFYTDTSYIYPYYVAEYPIELNTCEDMIDNDLDGLNYLAGKTVDFVNKKAFQGTMLAHTDGNVPNLIVNIPELNAYTFGYLVYFFEKACAMSGYLLGVNPFDQPGVEAYKVNMFALLGKPGFEEKKAELEKRLED